MAVFDVDAARTLAASLLGSSGHRWLHTQTAAAGAVEAACIVAPQDRSLVVAAAWLHDIGYVHPHPPTGYHPLDGAYLLSDNGWPRRLVSLVAHHSEARFSAAARGLDAELAEFDREEGPVADGLIYADMTAGPDGRRVHLRERLADARRRHAGEQASLREARTVREPHLILAASRVDVRLRRLGEAHHPALPVGPTPDVTQLVSELAQLHRGRDVLDLHAAIHAALSNLRVAAAADELRLSAHDLLVATQSLAEDGSKLIGTRVSAASNHLLLPHSARERHRVV